MVNNPGRPKCPISACCNVPSQTRSMQVHVQVNHIITEAGATWACMRRNDTGTFWSVVAQAACKSKMASAVSMQRPSVKVLQDHAHRHVMDACPGSQPMHPCWRPTSVTSLVGNLR